MAEISQITFSKVCMKVPIVNGKWAKLTQTKTQDNCKHNSWNVVWLPEWTEKNYYIEAEQQIFFSAKPSKTMFEYSWLDAWVQI